MSSFYPQKRKKKFYCNSLKRDRSSSTVYQATSYKHLGIIFVNGLSFEEHLRLVFRSTLLTIYKTFVRPHFDYGDIINKKAYNSSFRQKIESVQYNACLTVTGAIRGTSKEKLYYELGLESL